MNQPLLENLLYERRDEILAIAAKHGAYNVRVFGSVARKQERETSDIDFLVDYDPSHRSPWFPMGLIQDLETLLQRKVDVATPTMLKERMREQVNQEAVCL
ncbi:MAG TPA: nucleotidyltransferase domain-containing protein [Oscillatoriaceae cyanobacterium M33_DOE_052]|uniref:DNA polymerase subunit beta n=1 Tax=Planktothricoides sp. SpSt-374 TaxID=2282167 RepID=A0A7C3ZM84_9CYAN|nr:nucleotidyltransferase domain-containing protein [Oscillatoriaceae cyanobacterium M33_DOE_052]